jgi:hypothetical protein
MVKGTVPNDHASCSYLTEETTLPKCRNRLVDLRRRQHLNQLLLAFQQIKADKAHGLLRRCVIETQNYGIRRFMKSGSRRQLLRRLALDLQNGLAFRDVSEGRARVLVQARLLARIKLDLAHVDGSDGLIIESYGEQWSAGNRRLSHAGLDALVDQPVAAESRRLRRIHPRFFRTSAEFFDPNAMQLHTACSISTRRPASGT